VLCRLREALIGLQQALQWQPLQTSMKLLGVTGMLGLLVNKFTMVHPYLDADNRYSAINLRSSNMNTHDIKQDTGCTPCVCGMPPCHTCNDLSHLPSYPAGLPASFMHACIQ